MDADGFAALRDLKVFVREAATKSAEVGQSALGPSRASIVARSPESSLMEASEMRAGRTIDKFGRATEKPSLWSSSLSTVAKHCCTKKPFL